MEKWFFVAVPITIIAFIAAPNVWQSPAGFPQPASYQLPFFIILTFLESLSMSLGIAFIFFGYKIVKNISQNSKFVAWSLFTSISWFMVNWWLHDGLHKSNGENLQGLLYIEYAFHVTLMITAAFAAYSFLHIFSQKNKIG